jgi:hypothetical protein
MEELLGGARLAPSRSSAYWTDTLEHVGVEISGARAAIGWLDIEWGGPGTPVEVLRDRVELMVGSDRAASIRRLEAALGAARQARRRHLARCASCGKLFVPGYMHDDRLCQGCAPRELGVVY